MNLQVDYPLFIGLGFFALVSLLVSFYLVNVYLVEEETYLVRFVREVLVEMKKTFKKMFVINNNDPTNNCTCYCEIYI